MHIVFNNSKIGGKVTVNGIPVERPGDIQSIVVEGNTITITDKGAGTPPVSARVKKDLRAEFDKD